MVEAGQLRRLTHHYFPAYMKRFERLHYFSYLQETVEQYPELASLGTGIQLFPAAPRFGPPTLFKLGMSVVPKLRECSVIRVFQLTGALPATVARILYGTPYVVTYGFHYREVAKLTSRTKSYLLKIIEHLVLRRASGVIVTTETIGDFVSHYVPKSRIHLIPNGVDTQLFSPRLEDRATGSRKLVFVGRFEKEKNLENLIDAFCRLKGKLPEAVMLLVGEGSLKGKLKEKAFRHGDSILFPGLLENSLLPKLLNQADVFIFPSITEGHPKALLEAMSCGLPCVVSNIDAHRQLIQDGENGLVCQHLDPADMAEKVLFVLQNPDKAHQMGVRARQKIMAQFEIGRLLEEETALMFKIAQERTR